MESTAGLVVHRETNGQSIVSLYAGRCAIDKYQGFHTLIMDRPLGDELKAYVNRRVQLRYPGESFDVDKSCIAIKDGDTLLMGFNNVNVSVNDWVKEQSMRIVATLVIWKKSGNIKYRFLDVHFLNESEEKENFVTVPLKKESLVFNGMKQ